VRLNCLFLSLGKVNVNSQWNSSGRPVLLMLTGFHQVTMETLLGNVSIGVMGPIGVEDRGVPSLSCLSEKHLFGKPLHALPSQDYSLTRIGVGADYNGCR
jgi:hypothetical protein